MRFKQVCSQRLSLILGLQFLMGVVFSSFSFADTSSPWIELARYDLDHEGRVTCDYAKMIHTYLQSVPESDLLKGLQEERTRLEALKLDTPAEKRIRARALRDIHKILKQSQLRPALFERNQRLCEGALQAGRSTVHALSLGLSAIDSVFLFINSTIVG
jgi:hypothetical protein